MTTSTSGETIWNYYEIFMLNRKLKKERAKINKDIGIDKKKTHDLFNNSKIFSIIFLHLCLF